MPNPCHQQRSRPDAAGAAADDGAWAWVDEGAVNYDALYRSWARHEPLYRGAANCGALLHVGYDPYAPPRPLWRTHLCSVELPYVCTRRGDTTAYQLTVGNTFTFTDGELRGGGVVQPKKMSFTADTTPSMRNAGLRVEASEDDASRSSVRPFLRHQKPQTVHTQCRSALARRSE